MTAKLNVIPAGSNAESEFKMATKLFNENRFEDSSKILEKLSLEFPDDFRIWLILGGLYYYQFKDPKKSEFFYRKGTEAAPDSELCSIGLFHSIYKQEKIDAAFDEFKRFRKLVAISPLYDELMKDIDLKLEEIEASKKPEKD